MSFKVATQGRSPARSPSSISALVDNTSAVPWTMTFLGIVACQLGTGFAVRTETASLRAIGLTTNPLLLWGMAFEVAFSLALVYIPPLPAVFAFAAPTPAQLTILLAYPLIVWGVDELRKSHVRHAGATRGIETAAGRPDRRVMPM